MCGLAARLWLLVLRGTACHGPVPWTIQHSRLWTHDGNFLQAAVAVRAVAAVPVPVLQ
jgi:hypothetical protein